jgi:hypothetical protein
MADEDPTFPESILFCNEAMFHLNGTCNKQTYRWRATTNPLDEWETRARLAKFMVWCGIWKDTLIWPYFFESTVDSEAYITMLGDFLVPELAMLEIEHRAVWFQQDGAPPHYALCVRLWLNKHFPNWIGRRGTIEWLARSPDLTPMDFFLWGYLKSRV